MNTLVLRRNLRQALLGASHWLRIVAALGALALAGRWALLVAGQIDDFMERRSQATAPPPRTSRAVPTPAPAAPPGSGASAPAASTVAPDPAAPPTAPPAASTAEQAPRAPTGPPEVRSLLVNLGPPRSEVFVNTRRLGETPYAGQWTCRAGEILRVQVVPKRGGPLERTLVCGGTTMSVH